MSRDAFIAEFKPEPVDVTICASMSHKDAWLDVAQDLTDIGMAVAIPDTTEHADWSELSDSEIAEQKGRFVRQHIAQIAVSRAVLVYNDTKNGVDNYIGGNTFLEMGAAFCYGVPIFVYNPLPAQSNRDEMLAIHPVVINGDIEKMRAEL